MPSSAKSAPSLQAPYPPSSIVQDLTFDFSTVRTYGSGSDQWPMTWASDSQLYGIWGDGNGWAGSGSKRFMGVTRIQGQPLSLTGVDLWGETSKNLKPLGIVADANGKMYLFYATENDNWNGSYGMTSQDNGETWTSVSGSVFTSSGDGVFVVGIAQFGPGYTGLPSGLDNSYFYVYLSGRTDGKTATGKDVYLGRVSKADIFKRSAYEYFAGADGSNNPTWSSSWNDKRSVFHDDAGMAYHASVTYNPALDRYIYAQGHSTSHLGVFEGPAPWGPWNTVYYGQFIDNNWKFTYQFPQKWMSQDGKTMWMSYSGWPEYDNVNFVKATLTLSSGTSPVNQAPSVNAGSSMNVTLPSGMSLNGSVNDDGLPNGSLATTWSKVSGPGTVTFAKANAVDTTAGFSEDGTYVLRLTADDGDLSDSDDITITVSPAPTPTLTPIPTPIPSSGCPTLPGLSAQSRDLDSDGQCEDINGNRHLDFDDIVEFFLYLVTSPQQNPAELDFNGTQSQDMDDVVTLFDILMDSKLQP